MFKSSSPAFFVTLSPTLIPPLTNATGVVYDLRSLNFFEVHWSSSSSAHTPVHYHSNPSAFLLYHNKNNWTCNTAVVHSKINRLLIAYKNMFTHRSVKLHLKNNKSNNNSLPELRNIIRSILNIFILILYWLVNKSSSSDITDYIIAMIFYSSAKCTAAITDVILTACCCNNYKIT